MGRRKTGDGRHRRQPGAPGLRRPRGGRARRQGALIVAAVSGGPDSLALLHALSRLRGRLGLRLHAAHLDHRLRGEESEADARFVERACGGIDVPVTVDRADVPALRRSRGLSMEEAAREARYAFLSALCERLGADAVATGHTSDDRAETVLMNIVRGAGLAGLRGIEPAAERRFYGRRVLLVRPLLEVTGEETAAYCRALRLVPREDSSNRSTDILRNRVRLSLMPLLEEYNPSVREALVRLSVSASRDLDYVESQVDALWSGIAEEGDGYVAMDARALSGTAAGPRYHLLRRAVLAVKGDLKDVPTAISTPSPGCSSAPRADRSTCPEACARRSHTASWSWLLRASTAFPSRRWRVIGL